jgi:hypothetical protein
MQKLVVAFPLYRQVPVEFFFNWLAMDHSSVVGVVGTEAMYLPAAMELLVDMAFEKCPDFDRLVVFEHDMLPPANGLERMANYGDEFDIVGTVYFKHEYPHHVMCWGKQKPPYYSPITAEVVKAMVDNPALYECDAVAMGFTSISSRVFKEWDRSVPMWDPTPPLIGHDLHFCNEAKKQGFKVWIDSGIGSGHLTLMPIGYGHSQLALAEENLPTFADVPNGIPTEVG